jgi:hypothetical protein
MKKARDALLFKFMKSVVENRDCMEAMREMPDNAFDLARHNGGTDEK